LRNIDLQFATNVWNSLFVQSSLWCWPPYPWILDRQAAPKCQ
jgi:hypothetical protein